MMNLEAFLFCVFEFAFLNGEEKRSEIPNSTTFSRGRNGYGLEGRNGGELKHITLELGRLYIMDFKNG